MSNNAIKHLAKDEKETEVDDPFSCFGEDEDSDEEGAIDEPIIRDENSCGILSFHPQTESSLLNYVQNNYLCNKSNQSISEKECILKLIDDYCFQRHWMMHVGPEKRNIIQSKLQSAIHDFVNKPDSDDSNQFIVVELGTYCGYSAISIGLCLEKARLEYPDKVFKMYSFDVDAHYSSIANQLIKIAQLDNTVHTVLLKEEDSASNWFNAKNNVINTANFLFLDHDKSRYTQDITSFENAGLLKKDSIVIADNVLFAGIDDFTQYVHKLEKNGKVERTTIATKVEYCNEGNEYEDTIEIVKYL